MSRKVLELSLSAFLIACTVTLIVGIISLRPFFNSSLQVMDDSHSVLQSSTLLINELAEGMTEGKKAPGEIIKMLQNSSGLIQQMTEAIAETKDTPKELASLLQEIRLLVGEMKDTVVEAKKSQMEIAKSTNEATDVIFEVAIATAAAALAEQRIITPTDADEMIIQSIKTIESRSERLGKLARSLNDFRVRQRRPY
jgi:chromosome segregation ATPase